MSKLFVVAVSVLTLLLNGCASQVETALQPVKVTETTGCSLCVAAYDDNLTQLTYLLQHGANPNATSNGRTPIGWAIFSKQGVRWDIVLMLLHYHGDPNVKTNHGYTPLMFAAQVGNHQALEALIQAGANIEAQEDGQTALLWAVIRRHPVVVADLIKAKADPNIRNINGISALDEAVDNLEYRPTADKKNIAIIKMLLAAGAEANSALKQFAIVMHNSLAANGSVPHGTTEVLRLLLAYGAKPQNVRTTLLLSVIGDRPDLAKMLINAGDPIDLDDKSGRSAVDIAIRNNNIKQAKLLFRFGAGLREVYVGENPLLDAYADGNVPMARLIIKHGPFVFLTGSGGGSQYAWPPRGNLIKDKIIKNKATEAVYLQTAKPFVILERIMTLKINRTLPPKVFRTVLENYENEPLISPIFRVNTFSILALRPDLMPPIPERAITDATLGSSLWKRAKSRFDMIQAADQYEKAAKLAPWVAAYQHNLCILEYDANEFRRAEIDCSSYRYLFPSDQIVRELSDKLDKMTSSF